MYGRTKAAMAAVFCLAATLNAGAADLPYKAAPPAAPYDWSGFYAGGNVGWSSTNVLHDRSLVGGGTVDTERFTTNGFLAGVQGGYNFQTGRTVFGIEADLDWSGDRASQTYACPAVNCGIPVTLNYDAKSLYAGTVRGRLGYAMDRWLVYGTGGFAYGKAKSEGAATAFGVAVPFSFTHNSKGWTIGAGVENALTNAWSWKVEYLYASLTADAIVANGFTTNSKANNNSVRLGLNYHFGR